MKTNNLNVKQNGFRDCAAACLLSIIRYYGGDASKEELNYLIKTDKYGTNAYNLIEGAKTIGFEGYGLKKSYNELLEYENLPVIAHTKVSNMYHYVVIYEINKKYIKIMDPACGFKKISHNRFKEIYLGTILFLYPIKEIPKLKNRDKLFSFIINNFLIYKNNIIKLMILSLIITILSIIINTYLKVYIDYVLINYSNKLLITISICFIMVIFLKNIFENIRSKILINIKFIISKSEIMADEQGKILFLRLFPKNRYFSEKMFSKRVKNDSNPKDIGQKTGKEHARGRTLRHRSGFLFRRESL